MGKRIDDLLGRLTLSERIALLHQYAPDVERLGITSFRTGTEALHGVSWLGEATVFPQSSTGADGTPDGSTLVNAHLASGSPPRRSASTSGASRCQRDDTAAELPIRTASSPRQIQHSPAEEDDCMRKPWILPLITLGLPRRFRPEVDHSGRRMTPAPGT
ncbi:hypothetical protein [Streptomyces turgidiscabies]|uniref:Transposase n=1 Tax=Streptomyces turgidiscabies TaxID=85558 RepID=A0ABU0RWY3_9ACTN|nr:hypothetical protein [Streptomyces turgidiscabies]MDQ0936506.1 hypothetical protein [Streptomyces turgidiscabies]